MDQPSDQKLYVIIISKLLGFSSLTSNYTMSSFVLRRLHVLICRLQQQLQYRRLDISLFRKKRFTVMIVRFRFFY